jgi:hypothetical protein
MADTVDQAAQPTERILNLPKGPAGAGPRPSSRAIMQLYDGSWVDPLQAIEMLRALAKQALKRARDPNNREAPGAQARHDKLKEMCERIEKGLQTTPFNIDGPELAHAEIELPEENLPMADVDLEW